MNAVRLAVVTALVTIAGACGSSTPPPRAPAPAPPTGPSVAQQYALLPDTAVCVVDRTTDRGLRDLQAKRAADGSVVLLIDNRIQPLDEIHPVGVTAGYAGQEIWYTRGQPVTLQSRSYMKYGGERRVPLNQLRRVGDYQGIPLYSAPADSVRPQALYVPVRVGCIFNAYVREDLYKG
jgi:hypothetical protein